jgi:rRNA small subunit pseudouridine methyltransferase Nep1
VILEDSSLELVPKKYWNHESVGLVERRFGIPPESQILDDNFHHEIVIRLPEAEKRGRPDVVHFALLDIMGTPAYYSGLISPIIHTINNQVIRVGQRVRPPRTQLRFNGVMSKVLRESGEKHDTDLFANAGKIDLRDLVRSLQPLSTCCFSVQGMLRDLRDLFSTKPNQVESRVWIVGGFPRGHFKEETKAVANEIISISGQSLPAHVVTSRLSYEIERSQNIHQHPDR